MRSEQSPNCTLFLHIEKAAGSTMHDIMYANFMPYYVASPAKYRAGVGNHHKHLQTAQLAAMLRGGVKAAGGHSIRCAGDFEKFGIRPFCFAFLREPMERYVSHYAYQSDVMGIERSFEDFLADPFFANFMCKKIAGPGTAEAAIAVIESQGMFLGVVEQFEKSLHVLKFKLESLGLVKQFDAQFEVKNSSEGRASQTSGGSSELLARHQKVILENNREDVRLYEYALQRLAAMAVAKAPAVSPILRLPRSWRIGIGKAIRKVYFRPLEKRVGYDPDA